MLHIYCYHDRALKVGDHPALRRRADWATYFETTENVNEEEALSCVQPDVPALYGRSPERQQRKTMLVVAVVTSHGVMSQQLLWRQELCS